MEIPTLVGVLEAPHLAAEQLSGWGLRDIASSQQVLRDLADCGLSLDLLSVLCRQLSEQLPRTADPDTALANLGRYFFAVRSPLSLAALLERDPTVLPILLGALSLAPHWAELLIADPDALDLIQRPNERLATREQLLGDLEAEIAAIGDERSIITAFARFRHRHLLRIASHEAAARYSLDQASEQLSDLAETLVAAALTAANPPASVSVLAVGELGASQCDYKPTFELLVVYEPNGQGRSGAELHPSLERAAKHMARLLTGSSDNMEEGRVEFLRLPDGSPTAICHSIDDVALGFDSFGRTWHRQQMLRLRPIAGDIDLGRRVRERLEPWIFRRYLNRADESGIQALKRRILVNAALHQDDWRVVRSARGGLRDIEATVELMQLVVGNEQPAARKLRTLDALASLAAGDAVTAEEHETLRTSYLFFRQLAHRLQTILGPKVQELPSETSLIGRVASSLSPPMAAADLEKELKSRLDSSWMCIQKLVAAVFPQAVPSAREVELLLDPTPPPHEVRAALAPFSFRDPDQALRELHDLATEQIPFLSTRHCRHLLAKILPRLMCAIAATPDPDRTLGNLSRVSNSLGGKAVLWDLFSANPATLDLYVKLCAASPYLSDILTTNPGMIDELIDSLQLDRLPTRDALEQTLTELSRGLADTLPVLHDLKNAAHLRIGVRDILGKEDIDATHAALADVAETCLSHVADTEYHRLVEKHGTPTIGLGPRAGDNCQVVIVALGKLGGHEPNYHSPLDILLLYAADGTTRPPRPSRRMEPTANNHFFTRLAQQTVKQLSELTPKGRLFTVDVPLRPIGIGGALAMTFDELAHHFAGGGAPLWQWLVLAQARPVYGDAAAQKTVAEAISKLLVERTWTGGEPAEIRRSRLLLERDAGPLNLKRAPGGTLDVEFLVRMLELKHAREHPAVLISNTQSAIAALQVAGAISSELAERLGDHYRFLRRVESGLRLLDSSARHDLPDDEVQLAQLALLLGHSNPARLHERCVQSLVEIRSIFDQLTTGE